MSRAMSSGVAGLKAMQTGMDVIGNNIANVNTYGFKASRTTYRDTLYQSLAAATKPNDTNGAAGVNPSQVGYGATASSVEMDTGRAGMTTTGQPSDCYIDGEGYFVAGDGKPTGNVPPSYKYTRVGTLKFDSSGYLTDGVSRICGIPSGSPKKLTDAALGVITDIATKPQYIHYEKNADNDLKNITFASDGMITATNAAGTVVNVGQVLIAGFPNPSGLTQEGGSYYKVSDNSGAATCSAPGTSSTGKLVSGAVEASNVDLANEFSNMITTERGFQANSKIITVSDEMMETLVNLKR